MLTNRSVTDLESVFASISDDSIEEFETTVAFILGKSGREGPLLNSRSSVRFFIYSCRRIVGQQVNSSDSDGHRNQNASETRTEGSMDVLYVGVNFPVPYIQNNEFIDICENVWKCSVGSPQYIYSRDS